MSGSGPAPAAIREEAARLVERFRASGAAPFETGILQPAGPLLDLYGEDIRGRAFITSDPHRGETMLRPDFTVPLVRHHMAGGATPARYAYAGEVFRRQDDHPDRPAEYVQAGFEVFDGTDAPARDAEMFLTLRDACGTGTARIGDIGLLTAALDGLATSDRRRALLLRHAWRPRRFAALLARYAADAERARPIPSDAPEIGVRTAGDVADRIAALEADAATGPIPAEQAEALMALVGQVGTADRALADLAPIARVLPGLAARLPVLEARLSEIAGGADLASIGFEATHARSAMEYYDGFTFTVTAPGLPPLATGGRYDALTRAVSGGAGIPAVGGVIRPAALLESRG